MRSVFLALGHGARSERRPRSEGLAARPWRFRSASSTLVSSMAMRQRTISTFREISVLLAVFDRCLQSYADLNMAARGQLDDRRYSA